MSHLLDRLNFLQSKELEQFSNGHGQVTRESRDWEDTYRNRWRHDKVVRSTHGVNCTGSCSWKIYVKSGMSPGRPSKRIIRARGPTCPTTSHAAVPAARAIAGIFILPTA